MVLSGIQNGQSDIYVFNTRSRTSVNINDFYDDLQPSFSQDGKEIIFASNRVVDTLGVDERHQLPTNNNFDVFLTTNLETIKFINRITEHTTYK